MGVLSLSFKEEIESELQFREKRMKLDHAGSTRHPSHRVRSSHIDMTHIRRELKIARNSKKYIRCDLRDRKYCRHTTKRSIQSKHSLP